ncbi:MAG: glycosyltransferase [Solirubrobacteraceae bacterium]|nr:glycosyltransferase [Solirubrobacteraceae bacterium]
MSAAAPTASVVIPHFQDPRRLDLVLTALELQDLGAEAFEVIVADDGSSTPPQPGPRPYAVQVVGHEDLGNRTGPARNLGAAAAHGAMLVFLDGDTVPEPGFLRELLEAAGGAKLTVGRRRHADLSDLSPDALRQWLGAGGPAPPILSEPAWLADAYARSADLAETDLRSYRFIISAVLACPRALFERVGGFAEELVGYGGEDWELARRCWLAGADFAYAPRAVGWHDGPDLAGRPEDIAVVKNAETIRLAQLITDPHLRGRGLIWASPRIVVRCGFTPETTDARRIACVESLLGAGDIGVWLGRGAALPLVDPRVHLGLPGAAVLGRAELIVDLTEPVVVEPGTFADWQRGAPARFGAAVACSPRDAALGRVPTEGPPAVVVPDGLELERWFASREP